MGSIPPNDSYKLLFEKFYHLQNKSELAASQTTNNLEYSEQATSSEKPNLLSQIAISLYKLFDKKKQALKLNSEPKTSDTVQYETNMNSLEYEQQMIQRIYKLSKKSHNGYVLQSLFASKMTPEERAYIQEKYRTFGRFVVESHYLTISPQQNDKNQYWLKPKSISK